MGDLRLILAAICLVLLGGIWWWSARGSRQARGAAELRERGNPGVFRAGDDAAAADRGEQDLPVMRTDPALRADPAMRAEPETQSWGVPPFEPLSIKTADFERVPVLDLQICADPNPAPAPEPVRASAREPAPEPTRELAREPARASARASAARDRQKILTVRVAAIGPGAWPGERLIAALESQDFAFGRYQVYHRRHVDGRSVFCVASLVEPGTFDPGRMPEEEFRGISLFAVLPGPLEAVPTMEELLSTAQALADDLGGAVQDEKGIAMSSLRILELREEAQRFQALST